MLHSEDIESGSHVYIKKPLADMTIASGKYYRACIYFNEIFIYKIFVKEDVV